MAFFQPLSTERQTQFYDDLSKGEESRSLWGLEKRFSPRVALDSTSFKKYFVSSIAPVLRADTQLIDVGCGTGMYHPLLAPLCGSLTGVEISSQCAEIARETADEYELPNVGIVVGNSTALEFADASFDASFCLDVLHHVYDLEGTLAEIARVVKPGGDILIFEPNLLNPALLAMCIIDRNEWGAVSRCYRRRYERIFSRFFTPVTSEYNGLLIGPQGKLSTSLADFMLEGPASSLLRFMSPKIFFHMKNRG